MAVEFEKLKFTRDWNNSSDFPTYEENEQKVRADMQALHDETKEFINETLIPSIENMAVPGTGDMLESIYDPEGKRTNVYAYADQKMVATAEALQSHIDNRNNPHNVTAEQVMVTENVVNAIKETGAWSVDGVLTQLGSTLFGGETLYRWQKTRTDFTVLESGTIHFGGGNKYTSLEYSYSYSDEITVDSTGVITLVNPQTVSGTFDSSSVGTRSLGGTKYIKSSKVGASEVLRASSVTIYISSSAAVMGYDSYSMKVDGEKLSATVLSELVTSTDPNAHYDGEVDADGWTYNALDPITAFVPRIQTGSYKGTGSSGSGNPNTLTFSFVPKMVVVGGSSYGYQLVWVGQMSAQSGGSGGQVTCSLSGNTFSWYFNGSDADKQHNSNNTTYYWVAIG